ncbi:hypothetical protein B0T12DRAFT_425956 [Alternaria alternata]|nr:hypothetical protein B0T12DRAFT_425956 [Alternaria alternata]
MISDSIKQRILMRKRKRSLPMSLLCLPTLRLIQATSFGDILAVMVRTTKKYSTPKRIIRLLRFLGFSSHSHRGWK